MRYALIFLALAAGCILVAGRQGGAAWVLMWPSVSFLMVALAYAGLGPITFGKRADGTLPGWSLTLHLPYYACLWSVWNLVRWIHSEPSYHELLPGFLIGRRLLPAEVPGEVALIVDLTAEFREPMRVRADRDYVNLPILDARAPSLQQLTELIERLSEYPGTVYLHCAEGCGRTGLVAAAFLLHRGHAPNPEEAVRRVRKKRPGVHLSRNQQAMLASWAAQRPRQSAYEVTTDGV